ncbi:RNA polymerase II associated protein 1 [Mortierella polycephala]|uniref:RNA polymerase II associated protein 1 n=1 Tax=Mortierella polycephala TaxID=41804 RepID=A0A9P6Q8U9_9FUNG|nr:RNA polymerase II associated protein 1 [Mortierella polycephala]
MDTNPVEEERRRMEHDRVIRQRRQVPETEDELLAMQEEFYKGGDRPAASVVRVKKPTVISGSSASKAINPTVEDEDDDDMPPPLEKDMVTLGGDDDDNSLPLHPPSIEPSSSELRGGSRFLQDRVNKGPRTHFQTVGQRFEINLDDDDNNNGTAETSGAGSEKVDDDEIETEDQTRRRLANAGASMGQILNEVLEKPVGEAVAPMVATTALGSFTPTARPAKGGFKGKSLFAKRLAEAQGHGVSDAGSSSTNANANVNSTRKANEGIPASASYALLSSRADTSQQVQQDVIGTRNPDTSLPPKPTIALHSVLKKTPDSPHGTLMEQINKENKNKLANMTEVEIEQERAELLQNLDPELVKKLMNKRSTIQRRVSFSEGVKVEDKVLQMAEVKIAHDHLTFQIKRHEEEEGDHPLALKKKYYADVPTEPEKLEWMGVEGLEQIAGNTRSTPGKSVAPGPQPYIVQEADPPAARYRFDFSGKIMNDQDTPVHLGLHHHGLDPTKAGYTLSELLHLIRSTVPSQRILPLNIVAKVLHNCRNSNFASFEVRSGILRWLIDTLRAPVYLRAALDDKTDSGLVAAVNAIYAWTMPQAEMCQPDDIWDSLDLLDRGYERINLGFKYQTITRFANMELKPDTLQASQEQGTESEETIAAHAILASKEPMEGLLAMNILPRIRYILDVCQLPAFANVQLLDILLTLVRTQANGAKKVFECEGMISTLIRRFGVISWPTEKSDLELSCTVKAISVLDVVIRSSKKLASAVIEEGHLEPLLRFLVVTPEAIAENRYSFAIQTQVLKVFRSLAAYGLYCNVLGDSLQSFLLQDVAQTIAESSKDNIDEEVKAFMSRKLTSFFQLATAWTHAAADVHRTVPEHSLCWAQAAAFLDLALDGISHWKKDDQFKTFDREQTMLVASTVRYISTWARYLSTNPPDSEQILERVWNAVPFQTWTKSLGFKTVHQRLSLILSEIPELTETPLPHVGITMNNPSALSGIASTLFEVSLCTEYLSSHLTAMYYLARLTNAPAFILQETIQTHISESVFGLVEKVTKYELAIQDQIPSTLPPWMAFISRHGVYFVAHWLTAMDVLVYQQDPENSSHVKLTFFPLFQVTALSLLQIVLPGDECLSRDVLVKILFNPRVLSKLLNHNTKQITVVRRILEPLYFQYFIKSEQDLAQSQSLWNHDGRGIKSLVIDYGRITGQPLFNWLFYPIELLFRSKLTYVEESGTLIAATSVVHCVLDFAYSLLRTLDGMSFELIYMAALKVLVLEGEREPALRSDKDEYVDDGEETGGRSRGALDEEEDDEEEEDEGFMDEDVETTINRLMDHFSTRGNRSLVRDDSQGPAPLSEKMLSLLTAPLPFHQFMKDFMENAFVTGSLLQFQRTAARFLFPAMAISAELQLLVWQESFNFLGSVTTSWDELDPGTLKALLIINQNHDGLVTPEVLRHYLKAVVSGRVIKQRNPALYWIAVHHLARVALGPIKMPSGPPSRVMRRVTSSETAPQQEDQEQLSAEEAAVLEERRAIVKAIVTGTKNEELVRDWIQYDGRNHEKSLPSITVLSNTLAALSASSSTGSTAMPTPLAPSSSKSVPTSSRGSGLATPTSTKTPSRPLSLRSTSASFPTMGSFDYLNSDNILTPPECFGERRQVLVQARKDWIQSVVGDAGMERVEQAILAGAPTPVGHQAGHGMRR